MTDRPNSQPTACMLCGREYTAVDNFVGYSLHDKDDQYGLEKSGMVVLHADAKDRRVRCICGQCCMKIYTEGRRVLEAGIDD